MSKASHPIEPLLAALTDRTLTADERTQLADGLRDDAQARALYRRYLRIHLLLDLETGGLDTAVPDVALDHAPNPNADAEPTPSEASGPIPIYRKGYEPKPARFRPHHFALAAALVAACGIAVYLLAINVSTDPQPDPSQPGPAVATLIQTNAGKLTTPHDYPAEGSDYSAGEYTLSSGSAEFMLTNSVNVKLRGRSRMIMHNNMHASLDRGVADFVVPPNASGYTVSVPDGTQIRDVGTRFSVWVDDDGRAYTSVREGRVEIHANNQITPAVAGETWESRRGTVAKIDNTTGFVASADALVSWGLPDRAFGDREIFQVRTIPHESSGRPHAVYVGLIRFDLATLLGDVDSARLSLTVGRDKNTDNSPRIDQDIDVYLLPSKITWDEATITWRSAPDVVRRKGKGLDHLGRFTVPGNAQTNDTFDLDDPRLTDAIRRRVANGKKSVTLMVARAAPVDGEVFLAFQSRESVNSGGTAPTLTVHTDPRTMPQPK